MCLKILVLFKKNPQSCLCLLFTQNFKTDKTLFYTFSSNFVLILSLTLFAAVKHGSIITLHFKII